MVQVEAQGNRPEDWKNYIDFLKTLSAEGNLLKKPLVQAYSRAITVSVSLLKFHHALFLFPILFLFVFLWFEWANLFTLIWNLIFVNLKIARNSCNLTVLYSIFFVCCKRWWSLLSCWLFNFIHVCCIHFSFQYNYVSHELAKLTQSLQIA